MTHEPLWNVVVWGIEFKLSTHQLCTFFLSVIGQPMTNWFHIFAPIQLNSDEVLQLSLEKEKLDKKKKKLGGHDCMSIRPRSLGRRLLQHCPVYNSGRIKKMYL